MYVPLVSAILAPEFGRRNAGVFDGCLRLAK
jgi:hypothetical protein